MGWLLVLDSAAVVDRGNYASIGGWLEQGLERLGQAAAGADLPLVVSVVKDGADETDHGGFVQWIPTALARCLISRFIRSIGLVTRELWSQQFVVMDVVEEKPDDASVDVELMCQVVKLVVCPAGQGYFVIVELGTEGLER